MILIALTVLLLLHATIMIIDLVIAACLARVIASRWRARMWVLLEAAGRPLVDEVTNHVAGIYRRFGGTRYLSQTQRLAAGFLVLVAIRSVLIALAVGQTVQD